MSKKSRKRPKEEPEEDDDGLRKRFFKSLKRQIRKEALDPRKALKQL
jgi:hypothetical protein